MCSREDGAPADTVVEEDLYYVGYAFDTNLRPDPGAPPLIGSLADMVGEEDLSNVGACFGTNRPEHIASIILHSLEILPVDFDSQLPAKAYLLVCFRLIINGSVLE